MHKLLLKKIRLEIGSGQSIAHLSKNQNPITEMLNSSNMLIKTSSLDEAINRCGTNSKAFTYIIADTDLDDLDDFDSFLKRAARLIIRPGKLIIVATNLCTDEFKWNILFNNAPNSFQRPLRSMPPNYLKSKVVEQGYFLKNRFWRYNDKLLLIADIPIKY